MLEEACKRGDASWCEGGRGVKFVFVGGREFDFKVQSRANSGGQKSKKGCRILCRVRILLVC